MIRQTALDSHVMDLCLTEHAVSMVHVIDGSKLTQKCTLAKGRNTYIKCYFDTETNTILPVLIQSNMEF